MKQSPWRWVPTLYFAQGIPYIAVMTVAVVMYKRMGISNTDIALYTSWLYLPWVIKPLWSPFVDMFRTKRFWILAMQVLVGGGLGAMAFTLNQPYFFQLSLALLWLVAFASATHDIAADGFYILSLDPTQQAAFVGIRSTFYRIASIVGQGALVMLAGILEGSLANIPLAWSITFALMGGVFIMLYLYHCLALPRPDADRPMLASSSRGVWAEFITALATFFSKPGAAVALFFMLTYRFSEAQLLKLVTPFLLDARQVGGMGLSTADVGMVYGTFGVVALTLGGILGGVLIARDGLRRWLWPMMLSMTLTSVTFLYLAYVQPQEMWQVYLCVVLEQFGYGFGFTAYLMYLIQFSAGKRSTSHYALCTAFMALGMMLPGMVAGWLQEELGYICFFGWIMISVIVPFISTLLVYRRLPVAPSE